MKRKNNNNKGAFGKPKKIGNLTLEGVTLIGGKYDGCYSACTHDTVNMNGVIYVRTESESQEFKPALEWLKTLPKKQFGAELIRVKWYMDTNLEPNDDGTFTHLPLSTLIGISPLRINAYMKLIAAGQL